MTRVAIALAAILFCSSSMAGDLSHKETYTAEMIQQHGIGSFDELVLDYAIANSLVADGKISTPLLLVNGQPSQLTKAEADEALASAKSVEIMTDGDAIVINFLS